MTRRVFWGLVCVVAAYAALPPSDRAAEGPEEKLLLGFEEEDFARLSKVMKITRKEGKSKDGKPFVAWENPGAIQALGQWVMYKGNASQGDYAMGISLVMGDDIQIVYSPVKFKLSPEAVRYYGFFNNNWAAPNGALLNTCGVFRRIFGADWSAYDLLRLDVFAEDVQQTIRVVLEDEDIAPPIVRNVTVEPGKWATLEVDLRAAVKERGLDIKRMATLTVGVAKLHGKGKEGRTHTALIDNVRLAKEKAPAKLAVVRDSSSLQLPAYYRSTKPQPEKLPEGQPERTPLKLEKPFVIATDTPCLVAPVGWAAAYDNQRLLLGFNKGNTVSQTNVQVVQSLDGGKSWRGLDGGAKPSGFYVNNLDHGTGRGDVVGARADVLVLTNLGCNGPALANLRLFARKLTFTGKGWEVREVPDIVDCDLRHCNSNQSIVRTADGRLWAAYGLVGRLGTNCINARYSDDDGITWKGWAEGKSGLVPGSTMSDEKGTGFGYTFEEPCLVPFGKGIACIWQERHRSGSYSFDKLLWSHFDGRAWSTVAEIIQPKRVATNPMARPPLHAVSLGGKEIFLASALFNGVLHHKDGQWKAELPEVSAGSRLSAAGDKTVVVIAPVTPAGNLSKGPVVLRSWQRSADGQWSAAVDLATEEQPLSHKHDGIYVVRQGLVVQQYAPANFVPIAWTCEGQKWVKYLRVPVDAR